MDRHVSITAGDHSTPEKIVRVHGRGGLGSRTRVKPTPPTQPSSFAALAPSSLRRRLSNLHIDSVIDIGHGQAASPTASTSSRGIPSIAEDPSSIAAIRESMLSPTPVHTIRFSGRGGAGSRRRTVEPPVAVPDLAPSSRGHNRAASATSVLQSLSSSNPSSSIPASSASAVAFRVSGRGGAGSRPRQVKPKAIKSERKQFSIIKTLKPKDKGKGKAPAEPHSRASPSLHSVSTDSSIHNFPLTPPARVGSPVYGHIDFVPSNVRVIPPAHDVPVYSLGLAAESLDSQAATNQPSQEPDFQFYTTMQTYGPGPSTFNLPLEIVVTTTTSTTYSEHGHEEARDPQSPLRLSISAPNLQRSSPSPSSAYPPSLPSIYSDITSTSGITTEERSIADTWIEDVYEPDNRPFSKIVFFEPAEIPPTPTISSHRHSILSASAISTEDAMSEIRFASPNGLGNDEDDIPVYSDKDGLSTAATSPEPPESAILFSSSRCHTPVSSLSPSSLDLSYD